MPVEATVLPDGNYYLPASREIIPADMATPSPDDRFHCCTYPHLAPIANEFDRWPSWRSINEMLLCSPALFVIDAHSFCL